jgi:dTDP-4-amino-4,6-dideoxygalactose transaminase
VPRLAPPARAGWLRLPLLVPRPAGEVVTRRTRRLGIERAYPLALADLPGFAARVRNRADALPGARELARRLVTVPTHSRLTPGDVRALERWIAEATA